MRKRRFIILAAVLAAVGSVVVKTLWFASPRSITVPMTYSVVMNKVAQMRPSIRPNGNPRHVWSKEESSGELYKLRIVEGDGDPKFWPYTEVRASKVDEANTTIELKSRKHVIYGLLGERRLFFTERRRWKELQSVLRQ